MSIETSIPEAFKPAEDAKGELSARFGLDSLGDKKSWTADQGPSHDEIIEEHAFNYGLKDGAENIGQISRGNETDDARDIGPNGESVKAKKARLLTDIINKGLEAFYAGMDDWSSQDFKDFNKSFVDKLREKAKDAYEAGDYALYAELSDVANQYMEDAHAIWNDPNLTDEEKQEANEELIKEQDQKVVQEVIYKSNYESPDPAIQETVAQYGRINAAIEKAESSGSVTAPNLGMLGGVN